MFTGMEEDNTQHLFKFAISKLYQPDIYYLVNKTFVNDLSVLFQFHIVLRTSCMYQWCLSLSGMSVYNVVILSILGVAITSVIRSHQDATFAITAVFIIFCTTLTLCFVFVPKVEKYK